MKRTVAQGRILRIFPDPEEFLTKNRLDPAIPHSSGSVTSQLSLPNPGISSSLLRQSPLPKRVRAQIPGIYSICSSNDAL